MIDYGQVSVVMPAFNASLFISEAIRSVLSQTYSNLELIIIDDCSTDNTVKIVETFTDPRIRLIRNSKNSGISVSRNKGINSAKGEWIAFLDSDDIWREEKIEKQLLLYEESPEAKLIFTASSFINERGERLKYELNVPKTINRKDLLKQNLISCSSVLVKKELMIKYPMPVSLKSMHEDFAVWLSVLNEEKYAYAVQEPLLIYRVSSGSKSGNKLKAAQMNWNTYCYIGLNMKEKITNMTVYAFRNLIKYSNLRRGKKV